MTTVDLFYGTGSRYSYLASTQIAPLEALGATVRMRGLFSGDLIAKAGPTPFVEPRGQYKADYRTKDAVRWSEYYGVPYTEPDWNGVDWRRIAEWCAAAETLGVKEGNAFGVWAIAQSFAKGIPPNSDAILEGGATESGIDPVLLRKAVDSGAGLARRDKNMADAEAAGAFGVPTYVTEDGEMFWGQDRLPLVHHHVKKLLVEKKS